MHSLIAPLLFSLTAALSTSAQDVASLRDAPTEVARINLLSDQNFVFDFLGAKAKSAEGAAGVVVTAAAANFPALTGEAISMAVAFIGPCGLVTPHTHPRATEISYVLNGTMEVGFIQENGARFVTNTVGPGEAAVFPKGSIHYEQNLGCEPMTFIAALNSEDPGVNSVAQRYFGIAIDAVGASLGGLSDQQVAQIEANIPDNIALGSDECLARCNIKRQNQPTAQRQPRVQGNALPSNFSGPAPPNNTSPANGNSTSGNSTSGHAVDLADTSGALEGFTEDQGKPNVLVIALAAVCAVLGLGYVVLGITYFVRRRNTRTKSNRYVQPGAQFAPGGAFHDKAAPFEAFHPTESEQHDRSTPYDPPSGSL